MNNIISNDFSPQSQPDFLKSELEIAVATARAAGAAIQDFYNSGVVAEEKIGVDNFAEPVTEADRAASQIIVQHLRQAFPGDGILSEEETDDRERLSKERVWLIDPIDGTNGFISRTGDFAVQIGLAIRGESALGVVYEPLTERMLWATKNGGAWLKSQDEPARKLQVSEKADFDQMILAASRSHRSPRMNRVVEHFDFAKEIRRGSVGVKVGLLCEQKCDVYIHLSPRTKHWDTCAPEIILAESGGILTDLYGKKIVYNTADVQNHNGVVASNGTSHFAIITELKPLLREFGRFRIRAVKR